MNYNSIDEIITSGTTNMTILRNNTKQDDGIDTITGVNWFTYNGNVASTIYASGNSFIGFGSSSEHLKVNRRDSALYSLYREEGTLYNYYKFLKIRWKGYSTYSSTSSSYAVEYDVILWDTGDISLHMISIPTSSADGTYSLVASSTYSYTVSTASPDVTFKKTYNGFTVHNSLITLINPENRFLIRSDSSYYTISNDTLSEISVTNLTSDIFLTHGVEELTDLLMLKNLTNPEILYWTNQVDKIFDKGLVVGLAPTVPQIFNYESHDLTGHSGIKKVEVVGYSDDVKFTISCDNGTTWKYYDDNQWLNITDNSDGMNGNILKNISNTGWSEIISGSTNFQVRCYLPTTNSTVGNKLYIKYID